MKCKACQVEISPKYTMAITDNRCPACGKKMMSDNLYKKIFQIVDQIDDLGFEENIIVGIAAALASKFTLVPKDLALEKDDDGNIEMELDEDEEEPTIRNAKPKPKSANRLRNQKNQSIQPPRKINAPRNLIADDEDLSDISPEEERKIMSEWGLNAGDAENVVLPPGQALDQNLVDAVNNISMGNADVPQHLIPTGNGSQLASARHQDLLARAAQAKSNPNLFKVRRADS
jgi:hypothetical protein